MNINEALNCDVIAETEKIFNKSWKDFNELEQAVCILNASRLSNEKKEILKNAADTYHSMKWKDFKELLFSNGFVRAYSYKFNSEDRKEEAIILYKKEKGLIVFATSFWNMDVVNDGHLYGEIKEKYKKVHGNLFRHISTGGCIDSEKRIYSTQQDVREGLFYKLAMLECYGDFLPYWIEKNKFLWFLDYTETEDDKYDYKKITKRKIDKCPQEFKDIIYKNKGD
jgi:hypothetical protein